MKIALAVSLLILGLFIFGLSLNETSAVLAPNNIFVLEGSGFAVTEESIQNSEIDLALSTGNQVGSRTNILIEDGFVTLGADDFIATDLSGTALRDGRFIRINGIAENSFGDDVVVSIFGRLIQNSDEGSIYGFTGSITQEDETHKIIYTTKLSGLTGIIETSTPIVEEEQSSDVTVFILKGSHNKGISTSYIEAFSARESLSKLQADRPTQANYFFPTRVTIEPGTDIIFVNDDIVSHRVVSGTGLGSHNRLSQGELTICEEPPKELPSGFSYAATGCTFSLDGRIDSGEITPGQSWTATFSDMGFYRIIDPDYPWMNIVVYSFPDTGSEIIRRSGSLGN